MASITKIFKSNLNDSGGKSELPSEETFMFNFSLSEEPKANKKKKKRNKKKNSSIIQETGSLIDGDDDEDCEVEVKDKLEQTPILESQESTQKNVKESIISIKSEEAPEIKKETILNKCTDQKKDEEKKKQKNKKKKTKQKNNTDSLESKKKEDEDDDLDKLLAEMRLENEKILKNMKKEKKAKALIDKSSPKFMSPNDPELDSKSKLLAKYGQGRNLVTIGPQKVRDPSWLKTHEEPVKVENEIQYHNSPFTFSFGGL